MIFEAAAAGRTARVEVRESGDDYVVAIDGREIVVRARPP